MSEMVKRVALAIEEERKRWGVRTNDDGEEACRDDDSGLAGHFSEIHNVGWGRSAEAKFEELRAAACARAAIAALREPTPGMLAAVDDMADDKYMARGRAIDAWQRMIDAAMKETDDGREDR